MNRTITALAVCLSLGLSSQTHLDFLGAGHDQGIRVLSSDDAAGVSSRYGTIDGFEISDPVALADASRFLAQATLGYDYETMQMVAAMGFEAWIEEQFSLPHQTFLSLGEYIAETAADDYLGIAEFRSTWLTYSLTTPDQLRQRLAYNLSEFFVVSGFGSDLFEDYGTLSGAYYDVLQRNAFGNYRELLEDVSLNSSMGVYLSHMHNPKTDSINNIHPDENYAREIMQLFSIGLYELNPDGTRKLDVNGNEIPTYDNEDIRQFAKIFTGWGDGAPDGYWGRPQDEDPDIFAIYPMRMYEDYHEPGPKNLLNGLVVPAGQSGVQDFNDALDNLFDHPNVGPFFGRALIQFLVSSNPSPAYVQRVNDAFVANANGARGDMQALVSAVLLDPEARTCNPESQTQSGKLREPLLRYTGFLRAFNPQWDQTDVILDQMELFSEQIGQVPMYSPTVFNFFLPDFQPQGDMTAAGLVGPVFQIHNSTTSVSFVNAVGAWHFDQEYIPGANPYMDYSDEMTLANDPIALVERLNLILACGQLSARTENIILNAISQLDDPEDRLNMALYLTMIAPDYAVLK
ncbi:DUF1800 domain-containing protein [Cryomorphaceae bacterium]|nr:DUF1800 domain-containing protein [Cryomorphaceae bacterium]